jgi:hypothetical protein
MESATIRRYDRSHRRRSLECSALRGELGEFLNSLKTSDHLRHRLWPVVTLLTTRTVGDYEAMPLPKLLWGIYYLTRPFRLAIKVVVMMLWAKKSI